MKDDQSNAASGEGADTLDLRSFAFPPVSAIDAAFSTFGTDPALLAEAKKRGFYNGHTPYNRLFSTLFFEGGKADFKSDAPEEFVKRAWPYCRALMGSFAPSHEDKEAICAMLLSELVSVSPPSTAPAK